MSISASANRIAVVTAAILVLASCGGSPSPAGPSPAIQPAAVTSPPVIEITEFSVPFFSIDHVFGDRIVYVYAPEIVLTEKAGTTAASINSIEVHMPDGTSEPFGWCMT